VKASKDTEEFEGTALDFDQAAHLQQLGEALYQAGRCALYPAVFIAVSVGLRRGEVMGLRWQDVNLEKDVLSVRQNLTVNNGEPFITTPKTKSAIRDIPIPPSLHITLETHKAKQAELAKARGATLQASDLVFATALGTATHPANLGRALNSILEWSNPESIEHEIRGKRGESRKYTLEERLRVIDRQYRPNLTAIIHSGKPLPQITPHDLRHTGGTLMLRRGMPIEVVSKILGHARVSITMDTYRHVSYQEKHAAMVDLFEHRLPAPVISAVPLN
jgi:integrase